MTVLLNQHRLKVFILFIVCFVVKDVESFIGLNSTDAAKRFFKYFQNGDISGLPLLESSKSTFLPSPLELVPATVTNGQIFGLQTTKIDGLELDFKGLKGNFECWISTTTITGNYTFPGVFFENTGQFNTTLKDVSVAVTFTMNVTDDGILNIYDFEDEINYENVLLNLDDPPWEAIVFMNNSTPKETMEALHELNRPILKPIILDKTNAFLREMLKTIPLDEKNPSQSPTVPRTPSEHSAVFLKRIIKLFEADPLQVLTMEENIMPPVLRVKFLDSSLEGLSSIGDIRNLTAKYSNGTIDLHLSLYYPNLLLKTRTEVKLTDFMTFPRNLNIHMQGAELQCHISLDPKEKNPLHMKTFYFYTAKVMRDRSGSFRSLRARITKAIINRIGSGSTNRIQEVLTHKFREVELEEAVLQFLEGRNG